MLSKRVSLVNFEQRIPYVSDARGETIALPQSKRVSTKFYTASTNDMTFENRLNKSLTKLSTSRSESHFNKEGALLF